MLPPRLIVDLRRIRGRRLRHDEFAMSIRIVCRASSLSASSSISGGSAKRSCGPAGFYGTIDIHTDLEKNIADFLGTEDAIIYSQAFSTVSSVIPVLAQREDIIVVGRNINFEVRKGPQISLSAIRWFNHCQYLEEVGSVQ